MVVNRNLIFLWLICISLILLALFSKYSRSENTIKEIVVENNNEEPVTTNSTFYENTDLNNKKETDEIKKSNTSKKSPVSAKSYLVGNVQTGEIYIFKNQHTVLPVASMSKLITAVESIDQFSLSGTTTINEYSLSFPDSKTYKNGEIFTIEEALYPLLVNSSNVIAETLASTTDRIKFMDLMSSYAWEIGMPATYFADPSGLSPLNMSSAADFFALARYLYIQRSDILNITKKQKYTLSTTTEHGSYEFNSTHPFVNEPNFIGGKTGRTPQARDTMLTILNIYDKPIAFIVLGSEDRKKDTQYLINETKKIIEQTNQANP